VSHLATPETFELLGFPPLLLGKNEHFMRILQWPYRGVPVGGSSLLWMSLKYRRKALTNENFKKQYKLQGKDLKRIQIRITKYS